MMRTGILACALVALFAASPAFAQDLEIGSLVHKRRALASESQSRERATMIWHAYARCVSEKRGATVHRLLDSEDPNEVGQLIPALTREVQCNIAGPDPASGWSLNAPFALQRGMYAEALLGKMRHPLALEPLVRVNEYHSRWAAVSGRDAVVDEMAICVAATNPSGVEALLATETDSPKELTAFGTLAQSFGPCLAANVQLNANRVAIRAALAEALYHRATAPTGPAPASAPVQAPSN